MSVRLNPNWFQATIPWPFVLTFEKWKNQRNIYFENSKSKTYPLFKS